MSNKRGLSTVVTTLIIILLVLVAIGIVWVIVSNVIKTGAGEIFLGKFTLDLKIKNANVENSTNSIFTKIKRNIGKGDLFGIKFIFNTGGNSESSEQEDINLEELGEKSFNFTLSSLNVDNVETVSIAPIFRSDSGEKIIGSIVDTYRLKKSTGAACIPYCTGKECGSDGCGGSCGSCVDLYGAGYYCDSGTCVLGTNPCDLTSALWSDTTVVEGTIVTLNVAGTDCTGIDLNYSIYENDLVGDDFVTSFIATSLSPQWTSVWMDDAGGDPEYYFVVTVVDNPSEQRTSSAPDLEVTQAPQTCTDAGGTCMPNLCSTYTDCSSLSGSCTSDYCCSGTCTTPTESQVSRGFSKTTIAPGEQIDVTLTVTLIIEREFYLIDEYIPAGWTIIADGGGGTTYPDKLAWAVIQNPVDITYTYTVQAPSAAGSYDFNGNYMFSPIPVPTPVCGNGICERSDDSPPTIVETEDCPLDCPEITTLGQTTVTVS